MKAFLLAAGKGTRLRPLTDTIPKCMVSFHGITLLEIWIDLLSRQGIREVRINTHHHAERVEDLLRHLRNRYQIEITTIFEPELLGSAGTLLANKDFVSDAEDFLIAYADNLTDCVFSKIICFHRNRRLQGTVLTMGLIRTSDPRSCGIVSLDEEGRILRFTEKPSMPESDLANAGIYVATPAIFDFLPDVWGIKGLVLDIGYHLLPRLAGRMSGYPIDGYLRDIGTLAGYQKALEEWPPKQVTSVPGKS